MRIKDDKLASTIQNIGYPSIIWHHQRWAKQKISYFILVAGIHHSKYWMSTHYDTYDTVTIEDGQKQKTSSFIR